jgi:hypothetical protein
MSVQKRCSVCGELGHNKRRHAAAPIDVPAVGEPTLIDQLSDPGGPAPSGADLARAAHRKATGSMPATATGAGGRPIADGPTVPDSTGAEVAADRAWLAEVEPPRSERFYREPEPSGADHVISRALLDHVRAEDGRAQEWAAEAQAAVNEPEPSGLDEFVDPEQHRAFIAALPADPEPVAAQDEVHLWSAARGPFVGTLDQWGGPAAEVIEAAEGSIYPHAEDDCDRCRQDAAELSAEEAADVDPGPPAEGADCNCAGDGDYHPPGTGGCVAADLDPEETERPIEDHELPHLGGVPVYPYDPAGLVETDRDGTDPDAEPEPEQYPTPPWRTLLGPDEPIRITMPGVYTLTAAEYHDPAVTGDWLSNSDGRALIAPGCPAKWKYNRDNGIRKTSDEFDFGHAAHTAVLGKGEEIAIRPAEWDSWRTNAAKAWRSDQEAAGRTVLLPEQWDVVAEMAEEVYADPWAAELLGQPGGQAEACLFWVCPETGVRRRAMVDLLADDPVDYKTTKSACPGFKMDRDVYEYGYHRQAATIIDGMDALGLGTGSGEFNFIAQEKVKPYVVTVFKLDDEALRIGRIENRQAIDVYAKCLETGVWPGYVDGPVYASVPSYIAREYEDEMVVR